MPMFRILKYELHTHLINTTDLWTDQLVICIFTEQVISVIGYRLSMYGTDVGIYVCIETQDSFEKTE
jgi:hypothetical protein